MKKLTLFIILFIPFLVFGQSKSDQDIQLVESELGLHYINTNQNCNYIIDFIGDSVNVFKSKSFFLEIDGKTISITDYYFTKEQFSNQDSNEVLKELFIHFMNYEKEYLENEVYNSELKIEKEFFKNKENKQFLLWSFKIPEKFREKVLSDENMASTPIRNSFLFFVSNNVVVGIYISTDKQEDEIRDSNYLKKTADNIDVFGGPINQYAWNYKIESIKNNEPFTYVDSINKYKINIPFWLNVTESNLEGVFSGTLPDINNVIDAILIQSFNKEKYKTFDDFNYQYITGNKFSKPSLFSKDHIWMGQKKLVPPNECNGLSYKVYLMNGGFIYDCQYVTYETENSYILINYISTRETFMFNKNKFDEFLSNFQLLTNNKKE